MGGASSFYAMLAISGYLLAVWLMSRLSGFFGISSIVLEVGIGVLLGPSVGGLIPREISECYHDRATDCSSYKSQLKIAEKDIEYCDLGAYLKAGKYVEAGKGWMSGFFGDDPTVLLGDHTYDLSTGLGSSRRLAGGGSAGKTDYDTYSACLKEMCGYKLAMNCATTPDIFTLCGHTGVAMMIFESGMHFDFEQAKTVGPWACAVAMLGTFLPILGGTGLAYAFGFPIMPEGLAAGVSLAPTSVGIALKLLHEARALHTYFGQAVMTAAFVDDIVSLILFSVLFSLEDMSLEAFLPLILGCVFMVVAIIAAVKVWPPFIRWLFRVIPETKPNEKLTRHDEVWWLLMFFTLAAYAQITHLCGTHLWGCFIAGMSFATFRHAHHVWVRQVKRITCWLLRIFFSCTLAWSIPVEQLFTIDSFWKGTLMGIGPCIATKVLCAPFMGDSKWVIGWAMVGRAEFAYFIAIMAKSLKMLSPELFAILIWALIYATIFAPLVFRKVLSRYMAALPGDKDKHEERGEQMEGHLPDFEQEEIEDQAAQEKLHVIDMEGELVDLKKRLMVLENEKASAKQERDEQMKKESEQRDSEARAEEELVTSLAENGHAAREESMKSVLAL